MKKETKRDKDESKESKYPCSNYNHKRFIGFAEAKYAKQTKRYIEGYTDTITWKIQKSN